MTARRGRAGQQAEERGAVAVFLAVTVALVVGIGTLAVDLGMQRVVRRDMQALADVAALDLARELDGRTISELAAELGITLHELSPRQASLEQVFLEATAGAQDYRGNTSGPEQP